MHAQNDIPLQFLHSTIFKPLHPFFLVNMQSKKIDLDLEIPLTLE